MKKNISFTLNGQRVALDVTPSEILLDALRERLAVTSPKCGCDRGDCGACTVLLDGRAVRSCLVLAVEADGRAVTTVEGTMPGGQPSALQKKFLERNSFQCGFCAPGMILAATELLARNADPSRLEVQEALAGNLCRCTGYQPIVDAVLEHVSETRTGASPARSGKKTKGKQQ